MIAIRQLTPRRPAPTESPAIPLADGVEAFFAARAVATDLPRAELPAELTDAAAVELLELGAIADAGGLPAYLASPTGIPPGLGPLWRAEAPGEGEGVTFVMHSASGEPVALSLAPGAGVYVAGLPQEAERHRLEVVAQELLTRFAELRAYLLKRLIVAEGKKSGAARIQRAALPVVDRLLALYGVAPITGFGSFESAVRELRADIAGAKDLRDHRFSTYEVARHETHKALRSAEAAAFQIGGLLPAFDLRPATEEEALEGPLVVLELGTESGRAWGAAAGVVRLAAPSGEAA